MYVVQLRGNILKFNTFLQTLIIKCHHVRLNKFGIFNFHHTRLSLQVPDIFFNLSNLICLFIYLLYTHYYNCYPALQWLYQALLTRVFFVCFTGPFTVFVPTDKAFRSLLVQLGGPDRAEEKFRENPRLLIGVIILSTIINITILTLIIEAVVDVQFQKIPTYIL